MKKIKTIIFALCCATALLAGCSDGNDDNDNGNGNGAGNGGSGVTVLPKKITKITIDKANNSDTVHCKYDSNNRLSKVNMNSKNENTTIFDISYASDKINITLQGNQNLPETITLKNGQATDIIELYGYYRSISTFEYNSDGYLSKIKSRQEKKMNDQWTEENSYIKECHVNNGNLASITFNDEGQTTITFEYGNTPNNTNIDLWGLILTPYQTSLLCVMGKRFKNLPSKTTTSYKDNDKTVEHTQTYTYLLNADNYITKMTAVWTKGEATDTETYTISHE